MIRIIALTVCYLASAVCIGSQERQKAAPDDLVLHIAAKETTVTQGQHPQITAIISNQGKMPVTLVVPGDGSESAWRTPVIGWSAINVEKEVA